MLTKNLRIDELPYQNDSCAMFEALRDLPDAALLDSCAFGNTGKAQHGTRFDILVAEAAADSPPPLSARAPSQASKQYFQELAYFYRHRYNKHKTPHADLPFCGGLLGYIGYEAGADLLDVSAAAPVPTTALPAARLVAYDSCVIQDHLLKRSLLISQPAQPKARRQDWLARLQNTHGTGSANIHATNTASATTARHAFQLQAPFKANITAQDYRAAFERISDYIHAGDCYQVNFSQRFAAPYRGDPWQAYRKLRNIACAPFSGYLQTDDGAVLCLSPERFILLQGRHIQTRPIKGTRPRQLHDPAADRALAHALQNSSKDQAENLMIVDLLRNDIGRSCIPGSTRVEGLFELESYPTVHHLVSTISATLATNHDAIDLLRHCFPGGSITGAPKHRAMEIIAELETDRREAYCGSLLYISADGRMDSNIAIRSLLCLQEKQQQVGEIRCWAGGGIVADSDCASEYQESFDKVGAFLSALEKHSGFNR